MNFDIDYWLANYGYFGFFVFGLTNFVVPSEPVLTFAGFQIQQGRLNYFAVLVFALVGSFIKTTIIYGLGYLFGKAFLTKYSRWTGFEQRHLDYVKSRVDVYGYRILTPLQFVPVVRRFLGGPAGILRLNFWRFMYYNLVGVAMWFSFLMSLGYVYGRGYSLVSPTVQNYLNYLVYGIGLFFVVIFVRELWRHLKPQNKL
jgi:membrane protein DedA with SNARE-associated domain